MAKFEKKFYKVVSLLEFLILQVAEGLLLYFSFKLLKKSKDTYFVAAVSISQATVVIT